MTTNELLSNSKCRMDENGIWVSPINYSTDVQTSKNAWESFYNFDDAGLLSDRGNFISEKLPTVLYLIENQTFFNEKMVYLELGCGPAYLGEYLMEKYNATFIGIDFNYKMLLTLKRYLDKKGLTNYVLIYGDIHNIPLNDSTVDFIYGGGVIEHMKDTTNVLKENLRILKPTGVAFNTVPALNIFWLLRFWYSIPNVIPFRSIWEFVHTRLLNNYVLNKKFGYELSFTMSVLTSLYTKSGFSSVTTGPFYIPPYENVVKNKKLRYFINKLFSNRCLSPMYFVSGKRK